MYDDAGTGVCLFKEASPAQMITFKNVNYKKESKTKKGLGQYLLLRKILKTNGQILPEVDFLELLNGA